MLLGVPMNEPSLAVFESKQIRRSYDEDTEIWYFSIVDVVAILSESIDPQSYWRKLKERLKKEGNETVTNCHGLKMKANDGKMRLTDVATVEQLLRLIQSIPSPIFTALAELSTRHIAKADEAKGVEENAKASKKGGGIAKKARLELEDKTGKSVITGENFLPPKKK
jgi:hypothetical protein